MILIAVFTFSCTSVHKLPPPGSPGHRQTYRPLIQHLRKNNISELNKLQLLKKNNPQAFKQKLVELNKKYASVIVRKKGEDGNYTCCCSRCKKFDRTHKRH
jgi:hypothetical protein